MERHKEHAVGQVIPMEPTIETDREDAMIERYNHGLEEERRLTQSIGRIARRFLEDDLPPTRRGRAVLWSRLQSLLWEQARLFENQRQLYNMVTGWRSPVPVADQED